MVHDPLPPDGLPADSLPSDSLPADGLSRPVRPPALAALTARAAPLRAPLAAMLALVVFGSLPLSNRVPSGGEAPAVALRSAFETPVVASLTARLEPEALDRLRQAFRDAQQAEVAAVEPQAAAEPSTPEPATPFARQDSDPAAPQTDAPSQQAQIVPLPVPRPPELRPSLGEASRRADRRAARQAMAAAPAAPVEDTRSFFDKLFGAPAAPAPSTALGYAALDTKPAAPAPRSVFNPFSAPATGTGIAVYDISARTVVLPNGEKLEAHSGLGDAFDDPRHVHVRMRGPTPPGTYDLTEREKLFHGVRAIRLTPVGGAEAVHGRNGLLAHTFMLGPRGDSNGCVSFRDYGKFLQAFLKGEVQRLVVVAGSGRQDPLPRVAGGQALRVADAQ